MKKLIITCSVFFVVACNNTATKPGDGNGDTTGQPAAKKGNDGVTNAGACAVMTMFQQGAEIEASSYNAKGEETSRQLTKIVSVTNDAGIAIASIEGTSTELAGEKKATAVKYEYKCDGSKIFFDVASLFRTVTKSEDQSFQASIIEYPINLTDGEALPDATGTMSSVRDGKKMTMTYHYRDRKVDGKEKVTTPGGTWDCFKISNSVQVEMDIPGMDESAKAMMKKMQEGNKTTTTTWFAPAFGIVKMEMYLNGKLQSSNQVTAVKK